MYPTADFQPFTKILSADVNGKFSAISTLLNVTKLNYVNFQLGQMLAATQTSMQVVGTGSTGDLTLQAYVQPSQGGFGFSYTPVLADAGKVPQVNALGTALTMDVVPSPGTLKVLAFYSF